MAASPYRPSVYDIRCSLQPVDVISLQSVGHAIFQGLVERKAPARRLVIGGRNGPLLIHDIGQQFARNAHLDQKRIILARQQRGILRSEEHTSELRSLMRNSYDVFCL